MEKRIFVRNGEEVFGGNEVQKIEELSAKEIQRDVRRALTHLESGMDDYAKIIKVKVQKDE